jgi:tetratricopeptide (TPR) repeat protein
LLAAIDASGRETLVVLAADHGEGLGEHGEPTHGLFAYNSTLRVPLVIRFPDRRRAGQTERGLISLVDVMPSVLHWLGICTPDGIDGRAIAAKATNPADSSGDLEGILFENHHVTEIYGWSPLRGMIEGDWKLIQAPRPELYNLANDPREESNLAEQEPDRFDEMSRRLESRLSSITAIHSPVATSRELDDEALRKLESLGYVGGGIEISPDEKLADPKDMVETFERIQLAMAFVEEDKIYDATAKLVAVIDDPSQPRANPKAVRLLASLVAEESAAREQGIPCLQRLASRPEFPEKQDVFQALAMGLMEERHYAEAIEPWQRLIDLVPLHAAANYQLAQAYQQTGDTAQAIEAYQESLRLLEQVEEKPDWFEDAKQQMEKLSSGSP